jgi:hypothetical protein
METVFYSFITARYRFYAWLHKNREYDGASPVSQLKSARLVATS